MWFVRVEVVGNKFVSGSPASRRPSASGPTDAVQRFIMCVLSLVVTACLVYAIGGTDLTTSGPADSQCPPQFLIPISDLPSEDRNFSESDTYENTTVCVCHFRPCFLKCCPEGFSSSRTMTRRCVEDVDRSFSPYDYGDGPYPADYSLMSGFPCQGAFWDTDYEELRPDGSLISSIGLLRPGQFCLEFSQSKNRYLPLCCFDDEESDGPGENDQKYVVYPFGMLVSIPFLLATIVVYAIIPELRNTLHGMSFMCHIGCLIVGYSVLAAIQLDAPLGSDFSLTTCTTLGKY